MEEKQPYQVVKVANSLVKAVQRLSLSEKRLLMLAATKIDEGLGINQLISVTAREYAAMYSIHINTAYDALKDAESRLWDRTLSIPEIHDNITMRWLISRKYKDNDGRFDLKFHPDLDGYIVGLKTHFTQYLLNRASDFKHLYSWRLFELLMQYRTTGLLRISVDSFKQSLEVPEAYDKDFGLVRRKVIDLAVNEIKEKSSLSVSYGVIKRGRKITDLEFKFKPEAKDIYPKSDVNLINHQVANTKSSAKTASALDENQIKSVALSQFLGYQQRAKLLKESIEQHLKQNATKKEIKQFQEYGFIE